MRQGNDIGTQYRSGIYSRRRSAKSRRPPTTRMYQEALRAPAMARSRPRSSAAPEFYFAEDYHQQYLAKVPHGYCGLGGTGVSCPIGTGVVAA